MTTTQHHQQQINESPTVWEVNDALWERLEPVLRIEKQRKKSGRPPRDARPIFNALIWLARTGSQWSEIPRHYGAKSTIFDRFKVWATEGHLQVAWSILLTEYDELIGIDWEWQSTDGCIIKAPLGKRGLAVKRKRPAATPPTEEKQEPSATC
ncbi:transposase [Deinococcus antarcticus]|uniref:Transposase n=1 Tax=Deinococcus antarcticus TaxID=1298767 RepID=A0ABV8A5D2_9DEIO